VISGSAVQAQSSRGDGSALFQQGRAAFNEGNYELALPYFEKSQEVEPAIGTLLNLAVCEEKLGKFTKATAHLNAAMDAAPSDDRRRPLIADRLTRLAVRTPHIRITFQPALDPRVVVSLDSKPLDPADLRQSMAVDVGTHVLNCAGDRGERCPTEFTVSEGQEIPLVVSISVPSAPVAAASTSIARSTSSRRAWAYALGSVGLAGIATGLVAGAIVLHEKSRLADHCDPRGCDEDGLSAAREGKTLAVVSNVAMVLGAVSLGGSTWLFLSAPGPTDPKIACSIHGSF
jgi:hypothetical protein